MGSYRLDTDGKLNILSISLVATTSLQIEDTNERYYKARVEIDSSVKIACGHRILSLYKPRSPRNTRYVSLQR